MIHEIELDLINTIREIENLTILTNVYFVYISKYALENFGKGR